MPLRLFLAVLSIVLCSLACLTTAPAQEQPPIAWKTGEELETELQLPGGFTWGEMPLRQGLDSLARAHRVAIWLDRRVDPTQKVDFQIADTPFRQSLERLAAKLNLATSRVGPVIYIGPPGVEKLGTLAAVKRQESETLPAAARGRMANLPPNAWEEISEPRKLIEDAATRCGLRSFYLEQVPHDLWSAKQLPSMHGAELLTLLLAGFDLSFEYAPDGTAIRPIAMPERAVLTKSYNYEGDLRTVAAKIQEFFPKAQLTIGPRKLTVEGSEEEHREIGRYLSGKPMRRTVTIVGDKMYSLTIEQKPIGAIVSALAAQTGRAAKFDPALTPDQLNQPVSFTVNEKPLAELLRVALQGTGLSFELTSETISITKN